MGRFIKSAVGGLIATNALMFLLLHVAIAIWGAPAADWFGVRASGPWLWTPLTYMFTNASVWDLLFNMLWLWLFSRIMLEFTSGGRLVAAYVIGGLAGAATYLVAALAGLCGGVLFGASAAVIAIVVYGAVRVPYLKLNLMFFGAVSVKAIAIVTVALSMISFVAGNSGGGFAHLGGAVGGAVFALVDKRRRRFRIVKPTKDKGGKSLDELLDKVRQSGYASLTADERRQLLDYSKRL